MSLSPATAASERLQGAPERSTPLVAQFQAVQLVPGIGPLSQGPFARLCVAELRLGCNPLPIYLGARDPQRNPMLHWISTASGPVPNPAQYSGGWNSPAARSCSCPCRSGGETAGTDSRRPQAVASWMGLGVCLTPASPRIACPPSTHAPAAPGVPLCAPASVLSAQCESNHAESVLHPF